MPPKKKTSSSRFELAERGFFYDECITEDPLPRHVEVLRQSMLDFAFEDSRFAFDIEKDDAAKEKAERLARSEVRENKWNDFFKDTFFNPLEKSVSISNSRRVSRCNYYYDTIIADDDIRWVAFNQGHDDTIPGVLENETQPQPDYGFYLPIYHLTGQYHIPETTEHKGLKWHQSSTPSIAESFSWSVLKELSDHGLFCSPFNAFQKPQGKNMMCYPWLVVEFKSLENPGKSKRDVYRQAVNASGCAVRLNHIAAKYAKELEDDAQVLPVPAVTTVGPEVKVWITYLCNDIMAFLDKETWRINNRRLGNYVMQCIWEGNMTQYDDIVQFRLILENTYTWATRVFKPLIATYIDQWRHFHLSTWSSPCACKLQKTTPRRSPRLRARSLSRASQDVESKVETAASRLKAATATGSPKRRQSGNKFLAPPLDFGIPKLRLDSESEYSDNAAEDSECEDDEEGLYDYVRRRYVARN